MQASLIVTFIGNDRPGLVEELSGAIERNGGNWHESRLSQLGGKFAGIVLTTIPEEQAPALQDDLAALASSGLDVTVAASGPGAVDAPGKKIHLSVLGPDRPGIVREISRALAQRQVNVLEMESGVERAPMSAEVMFRASISACIAEATDMDDLSSHLEDIANSMTLEIDLD